MTEKVCAVSTALPITIVIPVYGASSQLRVCLESLERHLPSGCDVIISDDATPDQTIATLAAEFASRIADLRYVRHEMNLGFVENCNEAVRHVIDSGRDILLLNSDTAIVEGSIGEMYSVLHLHEKHAVVTPRSNQATIFSIPLYERLEADRSYNLWHRIHLSLPRFQVMPTCIGFCALIKNVVVRQFGLFDPVYSPGYNEENDFVCRINAYGYSAVSANHAYVFHFESSSFGPRKQQLEERNRSILTSRYPEYERKVSAYLRYYIDPVEHFAETWTEHRKRILFDLFHLPPKHCGTSEFALSLLMELAPLLDQRYDLILGMSEEAAEVFAPELSGYTLFNEARTPNAVFDLVYKPCQMFRWTELYRAVRRGVRFAYTHLDTIAVRCDYLSGPSTRELFRIAAELSDASFTISNFSKKDFELYYGTVSEMRVIHLGTHFFAEPATPDGYILIVGNAFRHKAVRLALDELKGVGAIIALGIDSSGGEQDGIKCVPSGALTRSALNDLFAGAHVVVYPSLYEGFGMPVLDAVGLGKPVVALDTEVNRELQSVMCNANVVLVTTFSEMRNAVKVILAEERKTQPTPQRSWRDTAAEYAEALGNLLESEVNINRLRTRWSLLRTLEALHPIV